MKAINKNLYADIKGIVEQARNKAIRAVNFTMVVAYWQIGQRIVEEEQGGKKKAEYGQYLLKALSEKLTVDFGKGFDERELRKMRQFFLMFSIRDAVSPESTKNSKRSNRDAAGPGSSTKIQSAKRQAVRGELGSVTKRNPMSPELMGNENDLILHALRTKLSWTHYRLLIRVENEAARTWYMNEAADQNWSTRVLERQINSLYFERLLSTKNKKVLVKKTEQEAQEDKPDILDFVKDPYILEFLQLNPNATLYEQELETELLNKLQLFLLELGKGFSFVARQQRISADNEHFFIDLVFYNFILKCFVLIDLKVDKLTHQDIGQMDTYVRYYEDQVRQPTDNPTIGLILCTEKNETIVKYSVLKESKQLFASKYKLVLPTEKELIAELNAELQQLKNKKMI